MNNKILSISNSALRQSLRLLRVCLFTSLPALAMAQSSAGIETAMINVDHRETTSLNGTWEVIIDPFLRGFLTNDLDERPSGGPGHFSYALVAENTSDKPEYGFENGETLEVPGDWNTQDERLFFYEGEGKQKQSWRDN